MKFHSAVLAVGLLGLSPHAADAQGVRITPVISTTHERLCEAETVTQPMLEAGVDVSTRQATIETDTRGLRATRFEDGYLFEQTVDTADGDTLLRFTASRSGVVSDAALSGSNVDTWVAEAPQTDLAAMALAYADDVAERLLMGRSFAVGDALYPASLQRDLLARMSAAEGLPFDLGGLFDVRYRGETVEDGRRVWRFSGPANFEGVGQINGRPAKISLRLQTETFHDVETGLVVSSETDTDVRLELDGETFVASRVKEGYSCRIVPRRG
jgi:hypothetical protein